MQDKEYTYLVSYAGRTKTDVVNGHIEITLPSKWSKGDTNVICEKIQMDDTAPDKVAIISVFMLG